jgi:hypothetical protein
MTGISLRAALLAGVLLTASLLALSACGKVGAPSQPGPPDQITYPRTYPAS